MSGSSSVIQLECQCNSYPWGKQAMESIAAGCAAAAPGGKFKLDESKEDVDGDISNYAFSLLVKPSNAIDKDTLKFIVHKILTLPEDEVTSIYNALKEIPSSDFPTSSHIPELLPRLASQYSASDRGNLVALLTMNFLILQKGDAIYVPADGIHAYLSGDIVECVARSDNVLNTGFCPRAERDSAELFSAALTFSPVGKDEYILKPTSSPKGKNGKTKVLAPPMSEFDMLTTALEKGEKETIAKLGGPSIMVITGGKGTLKAGGEKFGLREGYVSFVGVGTELKFEAEDGLEARVAFCEA